MYVPSKGQVVYLIRSAFLIDATFLMLVYATEKLGPISIHWDSLRVTT